MQLLLHDATNEAKPKYLIKAVNYKSNPVYLRALPALRIELNNKWQQEGKGEIGVEERRREREKKEEKRV